MKTFYRLLNYELGELLWGVLVLCSGLIVTSWIMMNNELNQYYRNSLFERFEHIYEASGLPTLFLIFFIALLLLFIHSIYKSYWGSKSIYTLLTLPVKREMLYWSKLSAFLISAFMLWMSQLVSVFVCYRLMIHKLADNSDGLMSNGLLLAFIRSDFLRLLWPYGAINIISTICLLLVIVTGVYYWSLCERSKRKWSWLLLPIVLWLISSAIGMRLNPIYEYSNVKIIMNSLILFALSGMFMWYSIHLLKKGAVV
jgi:hypothetical protein